ncbi:MAG TPA: DUF1343 domain-containing protein [Symbiobacteriaceae bacterium]|nr:DUF1343 domain-containing protein [Symbiobacteriaceae bacterium]
MTRVLTGIDSLLSGAFDLPSGRRVGIVTNHTGVTAGLDSTVDRLVRHTDCRVTALFSGEHGLRGDMPAGEHIAGSTDAATGLPVYSLYGQTRKPTPAMLQEVDLLLFDMQDAGARFYTYTWTMALCMQAAAENGKAMAVLDRPNPIGGEAVEGGVLHPGCESFVGLYPLATRHGLTLGEIARWLNGAQGLGCDLTVVPMRGWKRSLWYDQTGLPFVPPSPNANCLEMLTLYPGTCFFEATNISEGRGTTTPFQVFGAPWLDEQAVIAALKARNLPGVQFRPTCFTPWTSKFQGQLCRGVQLHITDRRALRPVALGAHLLDLCRRLHPRQFEWLPWGERRKIDRLAGSARLGDALTAGEPVTAVLAQWEAEAAAFARESAPYRLYQ